MKQLLFGALLLLSSSMARAETVDLVRSIEAGGAVRVDIGHGRLRIVGSRSGQVRVTGEYSSELSGVSLGRDAGAVEVRVRFPLLSRIRAWSDEPSAFHVDLVVEVPADVRLFVVSKDADLEIEGLDGPVGVGVVSSSVIVRGQPSRLEFEAVSGSLLFEGRTERLRASSLSGDLRVRGAEGLVELEVATGELELEGANLRRATLESVSGNISISGAIAERGQVDIETQSGAVRFRCSGERGGSLDLETRHGEILNEVSDEEPVHDQSGYRRLGLSWGEGSGRARVRTRSGLIWVVAAKPSSGDE